MAVHFSIAHNQGPKKATLIRISGKGIVFEDFDDVIQTIKQAVDMQGKTRFVIDIKQLNGNMLATYKVLQTIKYHVGNNIRVATTLDTMQTAKASGIAAKYFFYYPDTALHSF